MITAVKTGNEKHEFYLKVYLNDKFIGWIFIPEGYNKYRFVAPNPISLDGDAYLLIGAELNKMNTAI